MGLLIRGLVLVLTETLQTSLCSVGIASGYYIFEQPLREEYLRQQRLGHPPPGREASLASTPAATPSSTPQ